MLSSPAANIEGWQPVKIFSPLLVHCSASALPPHNPPRSPFWPPFLVTNAPPEGVPAACGARSPLLAVAFCSFATGGAWMRFSLSFYQAERQVPLRSVALRLWLSFFLVWIFFSSFFFWFPPVNGAAWFGLLSLRLSRSAPSFLVSLFLSLPPYKR